MSRAAARTIRIRHAWRGRSPEAAAAAADVDAEAARFPQESADPFRESGLLAALIPAELGGAGAKPSEVAAAVRAVARHCRSTARIAPAAIECLSVP